MDQLIKGVKWNWEHQKTYAVVKSGSGYIDVDVVSKYRLDGRSKLPKTTPPRVINPPRPPTKKEIKPPRPPTKKVIEPPRPPPRPPTKEVINPRPPTKGNFLASDFFTCCFISVINIKVLIQVNFYGDTVLQPLVR